MISCEFHDIEHFREQLRGWDTGAVQIEPGQILINFYCIDLDGLLFFDIKVNKKIIDHSRIEPGWINFIINLSPATFCGVEVEPSHMTVLAEGREYRSVLAKDWHSIEIVAPLPLLAREGLWLAPDLLSGPENATIALPAELIHIFHRLTQAAFGDNGDSRVDDVWLRRALLRALDRALRIGTRGQRVDEQRSVDGYKLTQKMIRYVEGRFGQRITVAEVASELGVTPRALHYAVRSIFGMSPLELILAFRLNHVRGELWDARLSASGVTDAALMQDFGHLGRFSQQYRTLFGELPSQTLHRMRLLGE